MIRERGIHRLIQTVSLCPDRASLEREGIGYAETESKKLLDLYSQVIQVRNYLRRIPIPSDEKKQARGMSVSVNVPSSQYSARIMDSISRCSSSGTGAPLLLAGGDVFEFSSRLVKLLMFSKDVEYTLVEKKTYVISSDTQPLQEYTVSEKPFSIQEDMSQQVIYENKARVVTIRDIYEKEVESSLERENLSSLLNKE